MRAQPLALAAGLALCGLGLAGYAGRRPEPMIPRNEVECVTRAARVLRVRLDATELAGQQRVRIVEVDLPGTGPVRALAPSDPAASPVQPGSECAVWRQRGHGSAGGVLALDPADVPLLPPPADARSAATQMLLVAVGVALLVYASTVPIGV